MHRPPCSMQLLSHWFNVVHIENTRRVSFYIKFSRQGFKKAYPSYSTCVLEAEPGKLDIKRRKPAILFISLSVGSLFKLTIMTQLSIFVSI